MLGAPLGVGRLRWRLLARACPTDPDVERAFAVCALHREGNARGVTAAVVVPDSPSGSPAGRHDVCDLPSVVPGSRS